MKDLNITTKSEKVYSHSLNKLIDNICTTIKWRIERENPEMIQAINYRRDYLAFNKISQTDLNIICDCTNNIFRTLQLNFRIINSMGEILPAKLLPGPPLSKLIF